MPVDDGTTSNVQTVSGETVQFFYYNASTGVLTQDAGQAAGTVVVANLTNKNVLNALGDRVGNFGDTSFSFGTGTILTSLRPFKALKAEQAEFDGETTLKAGQARANAVTSGFTNGEYCIDHEHGVIYGKKATTGTSDTGTYKVLAPGGGSSVPENVNIAKVGGTATDTNSGNASAGTQRMILSSGGTATRTTVTPALTSQTLISANTSRKGLRVVHKAVDPSQKLYFKAGATATTSDFFTSIQGSGELNLYDAVEWPYSGVWSVISDVASGTIQVIELT